MCNVYVGVGVGLLRVVPSFVTWFAISLPKIMVSALTFVLLYCVWSIKFGGLWLR